MYFRIIANAPTGHQTFLLADLGAGETVIIDPLREQRVILSALLDERDLKLRWILRTHLSPEQLGSDMELCACTGAMLVLGCGPAVTGACRSVVHGEQLPFGNEFIQVIATPGHSPHCVCYLWRDRLFCGEALDLGNSCQIAAESDPGQLYDSLTSRVLVLPDETLVFPTQMPKGRSVSTIGEERGLLTRLLSTSREDFVTEMTIKRHVRS